MTTRHTRLIYAAALAAALVSSAGIASAQEKTFELKLSHWVPASHPLQKALEDWGAAVEKASGGTLHYKVFPAQQLGKAFDHYDMARDGIADLTYVNPGYQPGRFPIIGAGELPFLISEAKGGSMGLDAWYRKYAEKEMKDVKFCLAFIHAPSSFHSSKKKIVVPGDIKGMKVRPADATMANFVTLLGGTNVQSSAPEVRDIIERGVADAVTFPWGSLVLFGIDKVTKYHMEAPLYVTTFAFVFNKDKYNQMSPRQKKAIDDNCNTEAAGRVGGPWGTFEDAGVGKVKAEPGQEVYSLTPAELAQWKKAAEPLTQTWADGVKKAGVDPDAAMKELRADLAKYKALAQ
jgi:TRAP-type C4-dicarboxylate transport system substrate-binding protein